MASCKRAGLREDLKYSATSPSRRVWTRSAMNTVKFFEGDFSAIDRMCEPCLRQGNDWRLIGRHKQFEFCQFGIEGIVISK